MKDINKKSGLNASQLQWIAVICMIIDHIAWVFFPETTPISLAMHFAGRLTFPIMAYFIAKGYSYSHNVPKYIGRVFLLAIISIVPFYLMASPFMGIIQNTVFTLAFGLSALYISGKIKNKFLKTLIIFLLTVTSIYFDGGVSGVLMIYFMGRAKNEKTAILGGIALMVIVDTFLNFIMSFLSNIPFTFGVQDIVFALGAFASAPLLLCYNGEKGKKSKYLFYVTYPLHLILIWAASLLIGR